jgi:hypothetical protein
MGNTSFIRNFFRNNTTSPKSTNVNQRIFPILKKRYELATKFILSLNTGFGSTAQKIPTASGHIG